LVSQLIVRDHTDAAWGREVRHPAHGPANPSQSLLIAGEFAGQGSIPTRSKH
jgi:hypothetical protein